MSIENKRKGNVSVYACGGCGLNVASQLESNRGVIESGFATLSISYIDTSESNLKAHIKSDNRYILKDLDGSGKIRSENHEPISDQIRAILQQFKPADLNIVLHSASGGSGSVIGPLLAGELLASAVPIIVLAIGSADTRLDAENTLKTLKSYENIAKTRQAPVVMAYCQNSEKMPRSEADKYMKDVILSLCVLFSRENHELDSKDLFNWLRFDRVTSYPVQLASLTLHDVNSTISDIGNIISVATLAENGSPTQLKIMPEYQCVGYMEEDVAKKVVRKSPAHFITSDGVFTHVAKELQDILTEMKKLQEARLKRTGILTAQDQAEKTGLIL